MEEIKHENKNKNSLSAYDSVLQTQNNNFPPFLNILLKVTSLIFFMVFPLIKLIKFNQNV